MTAIAKTIWLIESHFGMKLSLGDMAANAGVSRTYLSRIFPLATGYSISSYMRARRLSEAAKALAGGAPDILGVALDAGYGSHEAFTRAFRDQFGVTPARLRERRSVADIDLVDALPMHADVAVKLAPPAIEAMPARRFAGLVERHDMSQSNTIPLQWQRFGPYIGHVEGAVPGAAYGIVKQSDGYFCDYLSGVEIGRSAELPPEFAELELPARRWARISHSGHISTIRSTVRAIYDQWLPGSGERQAEGASFIEYYGPQFNAASGLGTCEVWIGLVD
jgi:AraC family transcriptional regulator